MSDEEDSENDPMDDVVEAIDPVASQPEATDTGFEDDVQEGEEQTEQSSPSAAIDPEVFEELKSRENERIKRTAAIGYVLQNMTNALASRTTNDPLDTGTLVATVEVFNRIFGIWAQGELAPLTWVAKEKPKTREEMVKAVEDTKKFFEVVHAFVNQLYGDYQFMFALVSDIRRSSITVLIGDQMAIAQRICHRYGHGDEEFVVVLEDIRRSLIRAYPLLTEIIALGMKDANAGKPAGRGGFVVNY